MEELPISLALIALSALFSGLTLGYFTLNVQNLRRQARFGSAAAERIIPIRERGNQLLTTLLLGNVAVNAVLSVYLSSLASGVVAATAATTLIFLFGEIIPQAVLSRHALKVGAFFAPVVRLLMFVTYPITFPISYVLDKALGDEIPTIYSKNEIMDIVTEHKNSEHSPIDKDEERIIHGALRFSHTLVREAMTPVTEVISFEKQRRLSHDLYEAISDHGYSSYPFIAVTPRIS